MAQNTVTGSFLAKHFPTLYKHFSENASQEEFNKAEQEAAVVFQNHNSNGVTPESGKLAADVSALLPTSAQALGGKLTAEELTAFSADMAEVAKRLTSQADSNKTLSDKLTAAETARDKAQGELATANTTITELTPKADAWDAHKKALDGSGVIDDANSGKGKSKVTASTTSEKDAARLAENQRLAAMYPDLMADLDIPAPDAE